MKTLPMELRAIRISGLEGEAERRTILFSLGHVSTLITRHSIQLNKKISPLDVPTATTLSRKLSWEGYNQQPHEHV